MKIKVKDLVEKFGVSQGEANGFLKVMASINACTIEKVSGGRGKPTNVYEFSEDSCSKFAEALGLTERV